MICDVVLSGLMQILRTDPGTTAVGAGWHVRRMEKEVSDRADRSRVFGFEIGGDAGDFRWFVVFGSGARHRRNRACHSAPDHRGQQPLMVELLAGTGAPTQKVGDLWRLANGWRGREPSILRASASRDQPAGFSSHRRRRLGRETSAAPQHGDTQRTRDRWLRRDCLELRHQRPPEIAPGA